MKIYLENVVIDIKARYSHQKRNSKAGLRYILSGLALATLIAKIHYAERGSVLAKEFEEMNKEFERIQNEISK